LNLLTGGANLNFYTQNVGTDITLSCTLVIFLTYIIAAIVQLLSDRNKNFTIDCDEKIEIMKLKLKRERKEISNETPALNTDSGENIN
jgi:hypothetical protein